MRSLCYEDSTSVYFLYMRTKPRELSCSCYPEINFYRVYVKGILPYSKIRGLLLKLFLIDFAEKVLGGSLKPFEHLSNIYPLVIVASQFSFYSLHCRLTPLRITEDSVLHFHLDFLKMDHVIFKGKLFERVYVLFNNILVFQSCQLVKLLVFVTTQWKIFRC